MKAKVSLLALMATATLAGTSLEISSQANAQTAQKSEFSLGNLALGTPTSALVKVHGQPTAVVVAVQGATIPKSQMPPQTPTVFSGAQIPDWAQAVTPRLTDNHVLWLYNRKSYAMGFLVDRLGFVDAVLVAGSEASAPTRLQSGKAAIDLGDDLRKIVRGLGYPDGIDNYNQLNGRTFALRYKIQGIPPANLVFTVRNYRVVRITML